MIRRARVLSTCSAQNLSRVRKALNVLREHHSRPSYPLLEEVINTLPCPNSPMSSWNSRKGNYWAGAWNTPKRHGKKDTKHSGSSPGLVGYDGRRVSFSQPSSAASAPSEATADTRTKQQLAQMTEFMCQVASASGIEIPTHLKECMEDSPGTVLKNKQKELNRERAHLNKVRQIRQQIEKEESNYLSWRHSMQDLLKTEQARFESRMEGLQNKLKELQSSGDGAAALDEPDGEMHSPSSFQEQLPYQQIVHDLQVSQEKLKGQEIQFKSMIQQAEQLMIAQQKEAAGDRAKLLHQLQSQAQELERLKESLAQAQEHSAAPPDLAFSPPMPVSSPQLPKGPDMQGQNSPQAAVASLQSLKATHAQHHPAKVSQGAKPLKVKTPQARAHKADKGERKAAAETTASQPVSAQSSPEQSR